jgi:hypothetical protein
MLSILRFLMFPELIAALFVLFAGCGSVPKYVEGTSIQLGAYIPWQGNLYGLELVSYVSGCVVKVPTNVCYEIERNHSVTNDWCWGLMRSVESSDTKIRLK